MRQILHLLALAVVLAGCGSSARGPYATSGAAQRDIPKAQERYDQALRVIDGDPVEAEQLLRQALGFDLYHGQAHNNLGVLLLKQGLLYDAAEEFEWARKLLPGQPEPRVNLALALHQGGKAQDAIAAARTALEVKPGNLPAVQTLAWIQVREHLTDETTKEHLAVIAQRGTAPWRTWAQRQQERMTATVAD